MTVRELSKKLGTIFPRELAEDYDNVGLLAGDPRQSVKNILVTLDCLESTLDEAIAKNCQMVISFHPILFKPLKRVTKESYEQKALYKAIQNDVAIYAIHTSLDNLDKNITVPIFEHLGAIPEGPLIVKKGLLKKIQIYTPTSHLESIRNALIEAGCGTLGNYDCCSFSLQGTGTFKPNEKAKPFSGTPHQIAYEEEALLSMVFNSFQIKEVLHALRASHPYEEMAYDILPLDNIYREYGCGLIGQLRNPIEEQDFFTLLKNQFKVPTIKHSKLLGRPIQRVAALGGSGAMAIYQAIEQRADAFITADLKYHDYFRVEEKLLLIDIGHYESEQFSPKLIIDHLQASSLWSDSLQLLESTTNTNPVYYS